MLAVAALSSSSSVDVAIRTKHASISSKYWHHVQYISHTKHAAYLCVKLKNVSFLLNLWIFKKLELRIKVNIVQVLRWEYFGVVAQCQNTFSRCFPCDLSRDILCLLTLCRFILSNGTPVSPTPKNPWILRASPKRDYSGIHWYVAYWLPWHQDK